IFPHMQAWVDRQSLILLEIELLKAFDDVYFKKQEWQKKEKVGLALLNKWQMQLGDEHFSTLTAMNNLAVTYLYQGRWKEAEELEVVVLDKQQKVLGDEHPNTLSAIANFASTYGHQGRWKEAEELEVVVLD